MVQAPRRHVQRALPSRVQRWRRLARVIGRRAGRRKWQARRSGEVGMKGVAEFSNTGLYRAVRPRFAWFVTAQRHTTSSPLLPVSAHSNNTHRGSHDTHGRL